MSKVYLAKRDFDSAIAACKLARSGSKRAQGKSSSTYIESCRLLILIYAFNEDLTAFKFYNESLPPESRFAIDALSSGLEELNEICARIWPSSRSKLDWLDSRANVFWYAADRGLLNAMLVLFWIGVDVNCVCKDSNVGRGRTHTMVEGKRNVLDLVRMGADELQGHEFPSQKICL